MADETENQVTEQIEMDNSSDTQDVVDAESNGYSEMSQRLARMEETVNRMAGVVSQMQKAQDNFVAMGGTIRESEPDNDGSDEGFVPLDKLDFTI